MQVIPADKDVTVPFSARGAGTALCAARAYSIQQIFPLLLRNLHNTVSNPFSVSRAAFHSPDRQASGGVVRCLILPPHAEAFVHFWNFLSEKISQKCRYEVKWNKQFYDSCYVLPSTFRNSLCAFAAPGKAGAGRWKAAAVAPGCPRHRGSLVPRACGDDRGGPRSRSEGVTRAERRVGRLGGGEARGQPSLAGFSPVGLGWWEGRVLRGLEGDTG